jgi:hypothetical protein
MRRRSFFSPTNQGDQPRVRITEQTLHSGSGTKAGEGVCIDQTMRFASSWHPPIMPNFGPTARALRSCEYRGLRVMGPRFLPTRNHEDPFFLADADDAALQHAEPHRLRPHECLHAHRRHSLLVAHGGPGGSRAHRQGVLRGAHGGAGRDHGASVAPRRLSHVSRERPLSLLQHLRPRDFSRSARRPAAGRTQHLDSAGDDERRGPGGHRLSLARGRIRGGRYFRAGARAPASASRSASSVS